MIKSRVIEILKTFSSAELKSFRLYVNSPVHNTNKNVRKILEIIKRHHPLFDSQVLVKENLFRKLYPQKTYNDIVMRVLISDMLRLCEEFLSYREYKKDYISEKKYLLQELMQRKLNTLLNSHIREAECYLERNGNINLLYFLNKSYIEQAKVDSFITADRQEKSTQSVVRQGEFLTDFFIVNGLNLIHEQIEHKEVLNKKEKLSVLEIFFACFDIEGFIGKLRENQYDYLHIIEIYYLIYRFNNDFQDDITYFKLKKLIKENLYRFDNKEKYNLMLALESCAISRIGQENKDPQKELREVYEMMLKKKIFLSSGRKIMQVNLFRNIFLNALIVKKYKEAEKFTGEYSKYLLPDQRTDMMNYAAALLSYERRNFIDALTHIAKVNYSFFVFKYDAKVLMLKIYYELKDFEPALTMIDSFSHFLTKNRIVTDAYKKQFMGFLKYLRYLIKLNLREGRTGECIRLEQAAKKEGYVINKKWILDKIDELKL